jgi:hypothetical protein
MQPAQWWSKLLVLLRHHAANCHVESIRQNHMHNSPEAHATGSSAQDAIGSLPDTVWCDTYDNMDVHEDDCRKQGSQGELGVCCFSALKGLVLPASTGWDSFQLQLFC